MKNNSLAVLIALVLSMLLLGIATRIPQKPPCPVAVSSLALNADPAFYHDTLIQLSTNGMQTTANPKELVYRKLADGTPVILCRFNKPLPNPLPKFIVGVCHGRHGDSVLVIER